MYLLDSGTCFALLKGSAPVRQRLSSQEPAGARLSAVVKAELLEAARAADDVAHHLELLQRFFEPFGSLVFDDRCAEQYAVLVAQQPPDSELSATDLMVAATALAHDLTLVTPRSGEFSTVAGLPVEDWTRD